MSNITNFRHALYLSILHRPSEWKLSFTASRNTSPSEIRSKKIAEFRQPSINRFANLVPQPQNKSHSPGKYHIIHDKTQKLALYYPSQSKGDQRFLFSLTRFFPLSDAALESLDPFINGDGKRTLAGERGQRKQLTNSEIATALTLSYTAVAFRQTHNTTWT